MIITARKTHAFTELKVDEIETTVFKSDEREIEETIFNLIEVINDIASMNDKSIHDYLKQFES